MSFDRDFENARPVNNTTPKSVMKFSRKEINDILISIVVLTTAFTIIMFRSNSKYFSDNSMINFACWFGICIVFVVFSFFIHEMGHKYMAQKYGAWSEYRMFPLGLGLCLIISIFGFLFAAPGAVYINGNINNEQNGKIAVAGPITNLVIAAVCTFIGMMVLGQNTDPGRLVLMLGWLNAFLALFNLLPIPPLDGYKVVKWNVGLYIMMFAVSIVLVVLIRAV